MDNVFKALTFISKTGKIIKLLDAAKKITVISCVLAVACVSGKAVYDCRNICCKG